MLKYFKIIASIIILSYFVSCSNKEQDSLLLDAEGGNIEISSTSTEEIEIEEIAKERKEGIELIKNTRFKKKYEDMMVENFFEGSVYRIFVFQEKIIDIITSIEAYNGWIEYFPKSIFILSGKCKKYVSVI